MPKRKDLKLDEYNISRYRYRELMYWCWQYPTWKAAEKQISRNIVEVTLHNAIKDTYSGNDTKKLFDSILTSIVRDNVNYDYLYINKNIPCSRAMYRKIRRKFYFLLDKAKS